MEAEAKLGERRTHANSVPLVRRISTASALPPVMTAQSAHTVLSVPMSACRARTQASSMTIGIHQPLARTQISAFRRVLQASKMRTATRRRPAPAALWAHTHLADCTQVTAAGSVLQARQTMTWIQRLSARRVIQDSLLRADHLVRVLRVLWASSRPPREQWLSHRVRCVRLVSIQRLVAPDAHSVDLVELTWTRTRLHRANPVLWGHMLGVVRLSATSVCPVKWTLMRTQRRHALSAWRVSIGLRAAVM